MGAPEGGTSDQLTRRRCAITVSSIDSSGIPGEAYAAETDASAERGVPALGAPAMADTSPDISGKASGSLIGDRAGAHGSTEGAYAAAGTRVTGGVASAESLEGSGPARASDPEQLRLRRRVA